MPKTAVGLFKTAAIADDVVREIESVGLTRNEVVGLEEPLDFESSGVMSIPDIDYEVQVSRGLTQMGATKEQVEAYLEGLRSGDVLIFATDPDQKKVDAAAKIMNRHGAIEIEETSGGKPELAVDLETPDLAPPPHDDSVQTGRIRQSEGGAYSFVW